MLTLLRSRSKDLENVVAHSQPSYGGGHPTLPPGVNFASDNTFSGPSFFERLFGGPSPASTAPKRGQRRVIAR
jgi:hypothetical protein